MSDQVQHGPLRRRRRRGHVLVQRARLGLRKMLLGQTTDDHVLAPPERPANHDALADADLPMRLGPLISDVHLAALAGLLGLRSGLEQTRDIEPDIQSDSIRRDRRSVVAGMA